MSKFEGIYKGTGPMDRYVSEVSDLLDSMSLVKTIMPKLYSGQPVNMEFERNGEKSKTILDMGDACFFDESAVDTSGVVTVGYTVDSFTASILAGKLYIKINVTGGT